MGGNVGYGILDKPEPPAIRVTSETVKRFKHAKGIMDPAHRLYTLREVAVVLRHSVWWLRRKIREGKLSAHRIGRAYFISGFELQRQLGIMVPRPTIGTLLNATKKNKASRRS